MAFEGRVRVGSTTERDGHNNKTNCKGYETDKTRVRLSRNVSGFLVPIFQIFRIKLSAVLFKTDPIQTLGVTGSYRSYI